MALISTLTLLLLLLGDATVAVTAFSTTPTAFRATSARQIRTSSLFMASSAQSQERKDFLPPPPEDQLIMTGDVAALFVYSFLDHTFNNLYVDAVQSGAMDQAKTLDPDLAQGTLPVWFDRFHSNMDVDHLMSIMNIANIQYSPALTTAGMASCALVSSWLLSGYLNHAFLFQNTVDCNTSRMLWVTGKTWLLSCAIMVMIALAGDAWSDCLSNPSLGGLTKADADYIFDSLTVLVTWRFMISLLLGGLNRK
jgi:hypothetical protein